MPRSDPWFKWDNPEPHKELVALAEGLATHQAHRRDRARAALTLWAGADKWDLAGIRQSAVSLEEYFSGTFGSAASAPFFNVIRACVDTLHAYLTHNIVFPMMLTERGNYELQAKAQGMERVAIATLEQAGMYGDLGSALCLDGLLFEGGGVKWWPDYANARVASERVSPWEVSVSERDARLGRPRSMIHSTAIDRGVLMGMFSGDTAEDEEARAAIEDAENAPALYASHEPAVDGLWGDQVLVHEAWHLPSVRVDKKNKKAFGLDDNGDFDPEIDPGHDGKHVIALSSARSNGKTLVAEPWCYSYFPIAWFKPMLEPLGYWSNSIPELLAAAQSELIKLAERISDIIDLHAVPTLLLWRKALINKAMWTNDYAKVIETSVPPTQAAYYLNPNSVPAELFNREGQIIQWAREVAGISELALAATKPAGIQHAPGLQMLQDTESVRHTPKYRSWARLFIDSTRIIVDSHRLLAERIDDMSIVVTNSKQLERITWKSVDIEDDRFHLKAHPVAALPKTPGARKSFVIDMVQNQMVTPREGLRLLEFPDTEAEIGDVTAEKEAIEKQLDLVIKGEKGKVMPLSSLDLELAMATARKRINRFIADGESWENIDKVQQYWEDCREIKLRAVAEEAAAARGELGPAPPPVPGPPGPPGPPPGGGGPPPPGLPATLPTQPVEQAAA